MSVHRFVPQLSRFPASFHRSTTHPCNRQESEEEREAGRRPARKRLGVDVGKGIRRIVLVLLQDQQSHAGAEEDGDVKDGIGLGEVVQPRRRQGVDAGVEDDERDHGADNVRRLDRVVVGLAVIGAERDGREQHLGGAVFGRCAAGDLADEIEPA